MCFELASTKPNALGYSRQADNLQNIFASERCFERKSQILLHNMLAAQNVTMKAFIPRGKTRCAHILLFSPSHNNKNSQTSLVRHSSSSPSQHASCEDQLRRKMLEKIIRVDHAGEMGASFIYQGESIKHFHVRLRLCKLWSEPVDLEKNIILSSAGQMAVLKNTKSRELIQEMWDHEKAHLAKFEELLVEYQVSTWYYLVVYLLLVGGVPGTTWLSTWSVRPILLTLISSHWSQVRPTVLIPVWKLAGFTLGAGCSLLGEKGAMACTVAVTY